MKYIVLIICVIAAYFSGPYLFRILLVLSPVLQMSFGGYRDCFGSSRLLAMISVSSLWFAMLKSPALIPRPITVYNVAMFLIAVLVVEFTSVILIVCMDITAWFNINELSLFDNARQMYLMNYIVYPFNDLFHIIRLYLTIGPGDIIQIQFAPGVYVGLSQDIGAGILSWVLDILFLVFGIIICRRLSAGFISTRNNRLLKIDDVSASRIAEVTVIVTFSSYFIAIGHADGDVAIEIATVIDRLICVLGLVVTFYPFAWMMSCITKIFQERNFESQINEPP